MPDRDIKAIKARLIARWDRVDAEIQKLKAIDEDNMLLNLQARKILADYLDRLTALAKKPLTRSTINSIKRLLNSLEYLVTVLKKRSKKKRPLV